MVLMTVDDSVTIRKIIALMIKQLGHEVLEAENGASALNKLKTTNSSIDLFVVDINMPEMNGVDFIKNLKTIASFNNVPIIVLTTEADDNMRKEAMNLGANDYVIKPFNNEVFLTTVKKYIK